MMDLRTSTITKYFGQLQNYYEYTLGDVRTLNENGFLLKAADTNCQSAPCYNRYFVFEIYFLLLEVPVELVSNYDIY